MFHTLVVRIPDTDIRNQLLEMLDKQDWKVFENPANGPTLVVPKGGESLGSKHCVDNPECMIGFSGSNIPRYAWAICAWIAQRFGECDEKGRSVVLYNGLSCPLLVGRDPTPEELVEQKTRASNVDFFIRVDEKGVIALSNKGATLGTMGRVNQVFQALEARRAANFVQALDRQWSGMQRACASV